MAKTFMAKGGFRVLRTARYWWTIFSMFALTMLGLLLVFGELTPVMLKSSSITIASMLIITVFTHGGKK